MKTFKEHDYKKTVDFAVLYEEKTQSKKGNNMVKISMKCKCEGEEIGGWVQKFLVATDNAQHFVRDFLESLDRKIDLKYQDGDFIGYSEGMFIGSKGQMILEPDGEYARPYKFIANENQEQPLLSNENTISDEEIPF